MAQCLVLAVAASAWIALESATNGSTSERTTNCFPVIAVLLAQREALRALLTMSSESSSVSLPAHADVMGASLNCSVTQPIRTTLRAVYQRRSRGPRIAPAKVQIAIVPPYQSATNGTESSVQ
jgi:hypothetical protein